MPNSQCEAETVSGTGFIRADPAMAKGLGRNIVAGDIVGAASLWIGNGFGLKMVVRLGARIFISGGARFCGGNCRVRGLGLGCRLGDELAGLV